MSRPLMFFRAPIALALSGMLLGALLGGACDSPQKTEPSQVLSVHDYWPLAVGNRWSYQIRHGGAVEENQVAIVEQDAEGFFVDTQGARLQHHPAGIFDGDRFLLRGPLEVGTKWVAVPSANALERFEITSVGLSDTVPAGVFENCVRVEAVNRLGEHERFIGEWTYAPGVGMVRFNSRRELDGKPPQPQTEMVLIRFEQGQSS